jgi:hypothetical protein
MNCEISRHLKKNGSTEKHRHRNLKPDLGTDTAQKAQKAKTATAQKGPQKNPQKHIQKNEKHHTSHPAASRHIHSTCLLLRAMPL